MYDYDMVEIKQARSETNVAASKAEIDKAKRELAFFSVRLQAN